MDKQDVKKIVDDEIRSFVKDSLDDEIKKIMGKSNTKTRSEIVTIMKNALEAVYKMLWVKRDFWKTDIR
jgi:hypothetical protein